MGLNKKGLFYTLMGSLLLGYMFLVIFGSFGSSSTLYTASEGRLLVVDNFIGSLEADGSFALYTGGLRGILAMTDFISLNGTYIDSVEQRLNEVLINGTLYEDTYAIIGNNTLPIWVTSITTFADSLDITVNITLDGITTLTQNDPWEIELEHPISVIVTDQVTAAVWVRNISLHTVIPIFGVTDPMYIIGTTNQYVISFNQSDLNPFVTGGDVSNVTLQMNNNYYTTFSDAPSFIMRFEGDFGAGGVLGIESLVDKDDLATYIVVDNSRSNADYIYFGIGSPEVYNFTGMPSNFHLDNASGTVSHISVYNLSTLVE